MRSGKLLAGKGGPLPEGPWHLTSQRWVRFNLTLFDFAYRFRGVEILALTLVFDGQQASRRPEERQLREDLPLIKKKRKKNAARNNPALGRPASPLVLPDFPNGETSTASKFAAHPSTRL